MLLRFYKYCGFNRVAAIAPNVRPADPEFNCKNIAEILNSKALSYHDIALFPELSVTGYTCGDLFLQSQLIREAERQIEHLATTLTDKLVVVGAPIAHAGRLYNCAVVMLNWKILGIVPKSHIPNYGEYYERRWFESGAGLQPTTISYAGQADIPFSTDILFKYNGMTVGIEICEDLWTPIPPSSRLAILGADVILNLSASNESLGKSRYRRSLILQQSARCRAAYLYASAGAGESSTDLAFPGYAAIASDGVMLAEDTPFPQSENLPSSIADFANHFASADIDVARLQSDRLKFNTFADPTILRDNTGAIIVECDESIFERPMIRRIGDLPYNPANDIDILLSSDPASEFEGSGMAEIELRPSAPDRMPFVPSDPSRRDENCTEIIDIQCAGLLQRIKAIGCQRLVIGVSGGLDSTLALLIAVRTMKMAGLPTENVIAITMPGLATTGRTRGNAWKLMELLGCTCVEIPIGKAVDQHFADIGQDPETYDATYENSQARERTQILMDYANKTGAIVVGTGDLSELALGWCTYNGDHMSMYAVNASVPKTLVRYLVEWFAARADKATADVLNDIVATPISPELVPAANDDEIAQKTEDLVGPYELHDFFLYHMLRNSSSPRKILMLACESFKGRYDNAVILKWLRTFYRRFFSQQFKRSCLPDGPKVGSVCLSPRGDWRMPSDASSRLWLSELESGTATD
ncbi:MAG: NAD(+) synthase [Muribaculaceae bacterium]|nr:NAD(+) synthase [Muribaculaceae bacterium]